MDLQLHGKVAIVTGGARGIGEAITRSFAAEGARVCVLGRNGPEGERLAADLTAAGATVEHHTLDVTDHGAMRAAVTSIRQRHGAIDVVVNNAGTNDGVGLTAPVEEFRASLERNLVACFALVQACREALIAARGAVVNIGTKCATTGQGGTSGYVAAKGGLDALTREWALDFAPAGVRVNCVIPAEVMTPQYARWIASRPDPAAAVRRIEQMIPLGRRMTTGREIADTVVFVASPRASHTTGQILYVDGGYTHLDRAATLEAL